MTFVRESLVGTSLRRLSTPAVSFARPLSTDYSPVGLWQFQGDLTDASGNGYDLSLSTGTVKYTELLPGLAGAVCLDSTTLSRAATPALAITGDLTVQAIFATGRFAAAEAVIVTHEATGETEATNTLYSLRIRQYNRLRYLAEQGAGVDIAFNSNDSITLGSPMLVQMTRASNEVSFHLNGVQIGATSSGLAAPTGGGTGNFRIGAASGGMFGVVSSVKVVGSALSPTQLQDEYDRSLGPVYGFLGSTEVTPSQLFADQNDYAPSRVELARVLRLAAPSSSVTLTGLSSQGGTPIHSTKVLFNVGAEDIVLAHESASSSAANRFVVSTGSNFTLASGDAVELLYDSTSSRWRLVS